MFGEEMDKSLQLIFLAHPVCQDMTVSGWNVTKSRYNNQSLTVNQAPTNTETDTNIWKKI